MIRFFIDSWSRFLIIPFIFKTSCTWLDRHFFSIEKIFKLTNSMSTSWKNSRFVITLWTSWTIDECFKKMSRYCSCHRILKSKMKLFSILYNLFDMFILGMCLDVILQGLLVKWKRSERTRIFKRKHICNQEKISYSYICIYMYMIGGRLSVCHPSICILLTCEWKKWSSV